MLRSHRLLIAARVLAGLTQGELAEAAGIALSVLQAIEQGRSDPKLSTVLALLDVLKARGVELLPPSGTVAWGVFVVPGSPADASGRPQPAAKPITVGKTRGRPPKNRQPGA
jgi:transcriptional regulator with XRE-family HTH domain